MAFLNLISRFATGTYTVTRSSGAYVDGEYASTSSTFPIVACVQPHDGRDTVTLPEGVRTEDVRKLWTATELRVTDANGDPDVVQIPGGLTSPVELFNVFRVDGPWTMRGHTHYVVWAARRQRP